jgi:hypothetical protein
MHLSPVLLFQPRSLASGLFDQRFERSWLHHDSLLYKTIEYLVRGQQKTLGPVSKKSLDIGSRYGILSQ